MSTAESYPTLIASVDPVEVASRICAQGSRAAIQASTVEIMALADRLIRLTTVADFTFDLLTTADLALAEKNGDTRAELRKLVRQKIDDVGLALEDLGYGRSPSITSEPGASVIASSASDEAIQSSAKEEKANG